MSKNNKFCFQISTSSTCISFRIVNECNVPSARITAPDPLSRMSTTFPRNTSVADLGNGPNNSKYCSPWTAYKITNSIHQVSQPALADFCQHAKTALAKTGFHQTKMSIIHFSQIMQVFAGTNIT